MPASFASIHFESETRRFGNPNRFRKIGKCSKSWETAHLSQSILVSLRLTSVALAAIEDAFSPERENGFLRMDF